MDVHEFRRLVNVVGELSEALEQLDPELRELLIPENARIRAALRGYFERMEKILEVRASLAASSPAAHDRDPTPPPGAARAG